jgi:hypothetical protein
MEDNMRLSKFITSEGVEYLITCAISIDGDIIYLIISAS